MVGLWLSGASAPGLACIISGRRTVPHDSRAAPAGPGGTGLKSNSNFTDLRVDEMQASLRVTRVS